MPLFTVTPPAVEPVTLGDAKSFLRVEHDDDDADIEALISAAREYVETATGLQLVQASYRLELRDWPADILIRLPRSPLRSVTSIAYIAPGATTTTTTLDADDYIVTGTDGLGVIEPAAAARWPRTADRADAVQVTFTAGYMDGSASPLDYGTIPNRAKLAVSALICHWYEVRAGTEYRDARPPWHVKSLIRSVRLPAVT